MLKKGGSSLVNMPRETNSHTHSLHLKIFGIARSARLIVPDNKCFVDFVSYGDCTTVLKDALCYKMNHSTFCMRVTNSDGCDDYCHGPFAV